MREREARGRGEKRLKKLNKRKSGYVRIVVGMYLYSILLSLLYRYLLLSPDRLSRTQ